jgi:hypothetical protein
MLNIDDLLETCPECKGAPRAIAQGNVEVISLDLCPRCNGLRRVLTPQGLVLQQFIKLIGTFEWR